MRRALSLAVVALALTLLFANSASAARTWCRTEPDVTVNGHTFLFELGAEETILDHANGAIKLKLHLRDGDTYSFANFDNGWGYGWDTPTVVYDVNPTGLRYLEHKSPTDAGGQTIRIDGYVDGQATSGWAGGDDWSKKVYFELYW